MDDASEFVYPEVAKGALRGTFGAKT